MGNSLSFAFEKTAAWRQRVAEKYPQDHRNLAAIELLEKLENEDSTSDALSAVEKIESDVDHKWYDDFAHAQNEVLKNIGFGFTPTSVDDVAKAIIEYLSDES